MALNPPLGTGDPKIFMENVQRLDKLINGPAANVMDRGGELLESWRAIRQNLIPLSKQYMSLADAQADIANIPDGAATYIRSDREDTAAGEYINNGGVLEPTGKRILADWGGVDITSGLLTSVGVLGKLIGDIDDKIITIASGNAVRDDEIAGLLTSISAITSTLKSSSQNTGNLTQDEKLNILMLAGELAHTLQSLDGFDPKNQNGGGSSVVHPTIPGLYLLPEPAGLVDININVPRVPASKTEPPVQGTVSLSCGGNAIKLYCMISVQGATSANYPKKNLNIEFYPDADFDDSVDVKIGDLLPHDEWTFKANWIDFTHVRNLMSYRLWREVTNSRKGWPKYEVDFSYIGETGTDSMPTGATGFPDGYPCVLNVNGEFYGIGDLMIGKKRKNYNLKKNSKKQIHIDCSQWFDITTFEDTNSYEIKSPDDPSEETQQLIDDWVAFCALTDGEFNNAAPSKLDAKNIIDFILFIQFVAATDLIGGNRCKNVQLVVYDGNTWLFMPYDLDTTYGLRWAGDGIVNNTNVDLFTGSFWQEIISTYSDEIKSRYAYLRKVGIFSVDMIHKISNELSVKYSKELREAESDKWSVPSEDFATLEQIYSWVSDRITYLDNKYQFTE